MVASGCHLDRVVIDALAWYDFIKQTPEEWK
jgi:hypothetical protein